MIGSLSTTKILIGLNLFVYVLVNVLLPGLEPVWSRLPLYFPENGAFGPWQFLTHLFMHGGTGHLFFNMFALFSFGSVLEQIWGPKRFLLFYLIVGLGAGILYTGVNQLSFRNTGQSLLDAGFTTEQIERIADSRDIQNYVLSVLRENPRALATVDSESILKRFQIFHSPVVGASGAIYGVLTAFGLLFPEARLSLIFLPVPVAAKFFIPGLLLLDLFSGVTGVSLFGGGIAHFAHLGGALIGFILMRLWKKEWSGIDPTLRFS